MSDLADSIINFFMSKFLILRYIMFTLRNGNFSVRRTKNSFNKLASDQCIEQTVNREQKCRGGISSFSTSDGTVQRWTLTSHCVAQCVAIEKWFKMFENQMETKGLGEIENRIFKQICRPSLRRSLKVGKPVWRRRFANQHLVGKRGYTSNTRWHNKRPQNRGKWTWHILERSTKI